MPKCGKDRIYPQGNVGAGSHNIPSDIPWAIIEPALVIAIPMRRPFLTACLLALAAADGRAEPIAEPVEISATHRAGDRYAGVRLLGALRLRNTPVDGFPATELSGATWDEDEGLLYAVSDAGHLMHLRPQFTAEVLTDMEYVAAFPLRDEDGATLSKESRDAEGLAIRDDNNGRPGDAELVVSFEGEPRLAVYRPDGRWIRVAPLPAELRRKKNFIGDNSQLEAVTVTPSLGIVVAPQKPLRSMPLDRHALYDEAGRMWMFPAIDPVDSSLVGMETAADGSIIVLERRYKNVFSPLLFALRRLSLDPARQPHGGAVIAEEIVRFDNTEGWMIDNFEGIARHRGNRYFLVSDDNNSAVQSTLVVYLEIGE